VKCASPPPLRLPPSLPVPLFLGLLVGGLALSDQETLFREQILNRQTFQALPACEIINIASLVGRFYAERAIKCLTIHYLPPESRTA